MNKIYLLVREIFDLLVIKLLDCEKKKKKEECIKFFIDGIFVWVNEIFLKNYENGE